MPVDPADQFAIGHIANEQIERIGGLVQSSVAQVMVRQRTAPDVIGLGRGAAFTRRNTQGGCRLGRADRAGMILFALAMAEETLLSPVGLLPRGRAASHGEFGSDQAIG